MTQKTDKELLELAAKALGLEWQSYDMSRGLCLTQKTGAMVITRMWNPRTDDGDCARMEAALGINVEWRYYPCNYAAQNVFCSYRFEWFSVGKEEYFLNHRDDRHAARRMASLRVAAAVGVHML